MTLQLEQSHVRRVVWLFFLADSFGVGKEVEVVFYNGVREVVRLPVWGHKQSGEFVGFAMTDPMAGYQRTMPWTMTWNPNSGGTTYMIPGNEIAVEATKIVMRGSYGAGRVMAFLGCMSLPPL